MNNVGTAVLMEALMTSPVERLIVASSMNVYGEGLYRDSSERVHDGRTRSFDQLRSGQWEVRGPDGDPLRPVPTPEQKAVTLESIYALSKYDQERMCLLLGRAYGVPAVALRFFNVYGTRQALSNPYTGVLASFAARLLNDSPPLVFEDGLQQRDFVSVHDVARACRLALSAPDAVGKVLNIGSGVARTIREIAVKMAGVMGREHVRPEITGKYRIGDVRHCFADIGAARHALEYDTTVDFEDGLAGLAAWLEGQVAKDRVLEARVELERRGLTL